MQSEIKNKKIIKKEVSIEDDEEKNLKDEVTIESSNQITEDFDYFKIYNKKEILYFCIGFLIILILSISNFRSYSKYKDHIKTLISLEGAIFDLNREISGNSGSILNININNLMKEVSNYELDNEIINANKKLINIAMILSTTNQYQTLVSITSALEHCKNENVLIYNILLEDKVDKNSINLIKSLKTKYNDKLRINFYKMNKVFQNCDTCIDIKSNYYILLLPNILKDTEKVIFLNYTTLVKDDLYSLYSSDFHNRYIIGNPTTYHNTIDKFGIYMIDYMGTDVLFLDLKRLRYEFKMNELTNFIIDGNKETKLNLRDSMNYIFYPNIGLLPYKYGIFIYNGYKEYERNFSPKLRFKPTSNSVTEAIKTPSIAVLYNCNPFPWFSNPQSIFSNDKTACVKYHQEFYEYASKTNYYSEILKFFGVKKEE